MHVGHYMRGLWEQGGIASYLRRVAEAQIEAGHRVTLLEGHPDAEAEAHGLDAPTRSVASSEALFATAARLHLDVLNLHGSIASIPDAPPVPTVRTLHDHVAYCPSGTQYLKHRNRPCPRVYDIGGCLWGHLAEYCGSLRPTRMLQDFQRFYHERRITSALPAIVVSTFMKQQMVRAGYDAERIHVLRSPAPVPPPEVPPLPRGGTPRFVFLGRLVPEKGLDWLLRAVARSSVPLHLDVAGAGHAADRFHRLADELGVTAQTTFHGWLDPARVDALIREARAVVFPSVWHEPAGLVPLEAAALGRPVIAARTGGIPEYVTEEYGVLVPPHDTEALTHHLETLATDAVLARRMGQQGWRLARTRFSMTPFLERLAGIYDRVCEEARSTR